MLKSYSPRSRLSNCPRRTVRYVFFFLLVDFDFDHKQFSVIHHGNQCALAAPPCAQPLQLLVEINFAKMKLPLGHLAAGRVNLWSLQL